MEEISGQMKIYIPIERLKDNHVYEVDARNFSFALWNEKCKKFFGVRSKWGYTYIDYELHWDSDNTHGTVKPLEEICEYNVKYCPSCGQIDDEKLMEFLDRVEREYGEQNDRQ